MTVDDLLERLEGVRRSGQGVVARCPAHDDHDPSLSVREGEKGLLLKCWAGCSLTAICEALGITTSQLFYDAGGPVDSQAIRRWRATREAARARTWARGKKMDALREAERVIAAATNVDISRWRTNTLDDMIDRVCQARALLLQETQT